MGASTPATSVTGAPRPQHIRRLPPFVAAQDDCEPDQRSETSRTGSGTSKSPGCAVFVPSPSWPKSLAPQQVTRPSPRRINLRPYVEDLRILPDSLEMDLLVTPGGTARPDELLRLLGLGDLLASGAVLERTKLELQDEKVTSG